ncbi:SNARE-like domain protein [Leptospira sp. GIMC2001]|uniref:SNARE-like domain protein n=1 Tax=Leptospira sp. GIMC2001 TaxID=1513297 RepID=UPI00234B9703|nr:SNARE-like domain protein [Leptospira sp. GIMC2001]WCL47589.1 SNARE-like domain protein [Leptospira sp. GIMC2001]
MNDWYTFWLIFVGTFVSEDLTAISAGVMAGQEILNLPSAILFSTIGIYFGDLGLFFIGKFLFKFTLKFKRIKSIIQIKIKEKYIEYINLNFKKIIFISRFLPGTRLPIYLLAGSVSNRKTTMQFIIISLIACSIWTPILVGLAFLYGKQIEKYLTSSYNLFYQILAVGSLFLIYKFISMIANASYRNRIKLWFLRFFHFEFWPAWLIYTPLVIYMIGLVIKYKAVRIISSANPGFPQGGGIANESKSSILEKIPNEYIAKFFLVDNNYNLSNDSIRKSMLDCGMNFPVILKPDVGERGAGIQKAENIEILIELISNIKEPYIIQEMHPGPFEAGIFYYRFPSEENGNILSITDKIFPNLIGDGIHNVEELIDNHPRFKFQSDVFKKRNSHNLKRILDKDEILTIGKVGNHIQGCLFKDGSSLITTQLLESIDSISKSIDGFFFGRYDIRYKSKEDFRMGKNFQIIELNGVTSESTNMYDPDFRIVDSYHYLFLQWRILMKIGYENYKQGVDPITWTEFKNILKSHKNSMKNINPYAIF